MREQAEGREWMGTTDAATRLGCSPVTVWRLIKSGNLTAMRAGRAYRIPAQLIEDARAEVMAGRPVVLAEFAREWSARQAAVAVA